MPKPLKPSRAQTLFDEHYAFHARYYGDEAPKKHAASAKRTATQLNSAAKDFKDVLPLAQSQTLCEAAAVMSALGRDLDAVCILANACKAEHTAKTITETSQALDNIAERRWGMDEMAMIHEARSLALFVDCFQALEVEEWLKSQNGQSHLHFGVESLPTGPRLMEMLEKLKHQAPTAQAMLNIKRRAAQYIQVLSEVRPSYQTGRYRTATIADFEQWSAWHNSVSQAIKPT